MPKQELLLAPETKADLVDSVMELHPNMNIRLQNTIINLVDLIAQAQLAKAEPLIRKDEKERIRVWGEKTCPHKARIGLARYKRECVLCWQALKEER